MMRAAVVPQLGARLEILEVPIPEPGPGQVLVRMLASGLCHTDIEAVRGDGPVTPNPPFVPGHEGVGIVESAGPGATLHSRGDRVAIAWLGSACGHCRYCVSGWETLCEAQQNTGSSVDGTWAEYALAADSHVVAVPDGVSSLDAAPLACAGLTAFKAVEVSRLQPGQTAAVYGIGGLGHLALQYARARGARVTAVDVRDAKLDLARELGADHLVNARTADPVEAVRDLGGADVAIVLATEPRVYEQAFSSLRRGGRLVCVALPAVDTMTLSISATVLGGRSVIGSVAGTRADLADVFALHAAGRTRVVAEARDLHEVNKCIDQVLAGEVPARLVFMF